MSSGSDTMRSQITEILSRLVAIPTAYPPGDSVEICAYAREFLDSLGYRTAIHAEKEGLDNLVASIGSGSPHLVFNAHVDTVGPGSLTDWQSDPYTLTRYAERLYGLGASNCKGSMAIQLWLAQEIARHGGPERGTVTFTFVTDEESLGPSGMSYLRRAGLVRPDMLFLGAPTANTLITAERGVMWVAIETFGQSAHAGAPETGDNAVLRMVRLVDRLVRDLVPVIEARTEEGLRSTINIGKFHGGDNTNVVPSYCRLEIDRRLLPSETLEGAVEEIVAVLRAAGEPEGSWTAELTTGTPGFSSGRDGPLVRHTAEAVEAVTGKAAVYSEAVGASDGRYFAQDGIEILNFGPGEGSRGHAANEFIGLDELEEGALVLARVVERICAWKETVFG